MSYICPLCAEGWILRNRVPLSETKSMSYDLTQPQQPRALDFRHQTLHSSSRWQQHTTIISWHTRGVLTTMTSLQKVFSLIPKCYAWFWFRNNTHMHDYHKSHNHKKRGRTWENSNSTQFDSFRSVLGCLGTLPKNHSEPPGFFCMQTRSSEALVLKNCVCWISMPLCGCVFFRKHQVVLLSLQRTTHQYQRIWRWWWQTLFDPGVFSDNSLLWRISFTFCLLFYLPRHFRLPEIYPMSRCANVMTPFFRHSPAQSKTPLCGKEHTLLFNMSQRNMCQCVNDVSKPTPHHRIHIR